MGQEMPRKQQVGQLRTVELDCLEGHRTVHLTVVECMEGECTEEVCMEEECMVEGCTGEACMGVVCMDREAYSETLILT